MVPRSGVEAAVSAADACARKSRENARSEWSWWDQQHRR